MISAMGNGIELIEFPFSKCNASRSDDIKPPENRMRIFLLNAVYVAHADQDSVAMAIYAANKAFVDSWGEQLTKPEIDEYVLFGHAMRALDDLLSIFLCALQTFEAVQGRNSQVI